MIAEWEKAWICPLSGRGSLPGYGTVFQGIFPWLITLCQPTLASVTKMAESPLNGTTQPVDIAEEDRSLAVGR